MATPNKTALLQMLGVDEDEQQPDPVGSPLELAPAMGVAPGIAPGEMSPNQGPAPVIDQAPPAAPDYTKRGKFSTFNAGAADKYDRPWDQLSERYKMQTVLSNFDPSQGITPEVLAALNGANIKGAKFSGSKDKLDARGLEQWENYDGREGIGDIIQGFNDPNNANKSWGAWQPEEGQAELPGGGGTGANGLAGAQSNLNGLLQGNPMEAIQQAIAQLMQGGNKPNLQALLSQLGGQ